MRNDTKQLLADAIEELNLQLEEDERVEFSEGLRLVGSASEIDSMAFVSFVAIVEDLAHDHIGSEITLLDDKAFSASRSPFATIATLGDYIDNERE